MQEQNDKHKSMNMKATEGFDILTWLVASHSACIYPFIRCGFGVRGIGAPGVFAAFLMLIYAGMSNSQEMMTYFYAWLVVMIWRCIRADREQHSRYPGWPWLASLLMFGSKKEMRLRNIEPMMIFAIGGLLCSWSEPVGMFVICGVISMSIKTGIDSSLIAAQRRAIRDAKIEMYRMQQESDE